MPPLKISKPVISKGIERERLFGLLREGLGKPAVWVWGPPGSGKTALAATFAKGCGRRVLWYQMDRSDADLSSFFHYLSLAAEELDPGGETLLPFSPEYFISPSAFALKFFESFFLRLGEGLLLVFDDCQEVGRNKLVFGMLADTLSRLGGGITFLFCSRTPPPSAFARAEARSALMRIGWGDLKFTDDEAMSMCAARNKRERLTPELLKQADGWAAGLVFLLEGDFAPRANGRGFAPEVFFDYFSSEIFEKLDEDEKDRLIALAVLPNIFSGPVGELLPEGDVVAMLERFSADNFFLIRKDSTPCSYVFHPLVRDFLLREAASRFSQAELSLLRQKAGRVMAGCGHPECAAELFMEAKAWDEFAAMVLALAPSLAQSGRISLLEEWLGALPRCEVASHPRLLYWRGICRLPYDPVEALSDFNCAIEGFEKTGDSSGVFICWAAMAEVILYSFEDFSRLDRLIENLGELEARFGGVTPGVVEARVSAGMFLALLMRNPGHPDFGKWREKALTLSRSFEEPNLSAFVLYYEALDAQLRGNFPRAEVSIEELRALYKSAPLVPVLALTLKLIETVQANVAADCEGCVSKGEEGLALARESGMELFDFRLMAQMAQCLLTCGDAARARKYIDRMEVSPAARLGWNRAALSYLKALDALCSGKHAKALQHAGQAVEGALAAGSFKQIQNALLLKAEALIENGGYDEASELAERAARESSRCGVPFITFTARLTLAFLHYRKKDREGLKVELRKALSLGRRHGFVNTPLWRAGVMSALLREALLLGIETDYAAMCVEFRGLSPASPPEELEDWPWAVRLRAFGPLKIELHRRPVTFHGKVQKKPVHLLKLLAAVAPGQISDDTAIAALWPDSDFLAGRQALNVTVHRLRALLEEKDALLHEEGWLSLNPRLVWVDTGAFRKHLKKAVEFAKSGELQNAFGHLEAAGSLFRGTFLGGDASDPLFVGAREKLKDAIRAAICAGGRALEASEEWGAGAEWYSSGLRLNSRFEPFYIGLMRCQSRLGRASEASETFQRLKKMLSTSFGVEPSLESREIAAGIIH